MSRLGRYWIFFVIVAVGLALSWGQVGRKTQRVLEAGPLVYLKTESDCQARLAPCAAVAADRAVVLGPDATGLRLKQTGLTLSAIVRVEAVFLAADGGALGDQVLARSGDAWLARDVPVSASVLRVAIVENQATTVAEFEL